MRIAIAVFLAAFFIGASGSARSAEKERKTILVAAAASLQYSFVDELIPLFQKKYPWITVEGTYDSSGKLQTQIENGLGADVFMSAAMRQMEALTESGFIRPDSVVTLLENRIVLIRPAASALAMAGFTDILKADTIAVGDPDSVPAGQYAREALVSLGIWDQVKAKASLGTNVTEVLNWVAEDSADAGIVYATDAAANPKVAVVAEAPEGSLKKKVLYPAGALSASKHPEEARLFIETLASDEGKAIFRKYGFSPVE